MRNFMRKTKIVCTLGPATDDEKILRELITSGMNVARMNFSHGSHDEHLARLEMVRKVSSEMDVPLAVLLDTKGPEVRIKQFAEGKIELKKGDLFKLTSREVTGNHEEVSLTYDGLSHDVSRGDMILLDDGLIGMKVISTTSTDVECEVINGGPLSNNKSLNIPGITVKLPFVSDIDREDLAFGVRHGFDFIAASFVRTPRDIKDLKKVLEEEGDNDIKIIAKIENREGVDNIKEIIRVSDGIMVARGDMGVEIPFEELPAIQKDIIRKCYVAGKPAITATQMLDSMIRHPRPTRAEITDVANAIYDNTSAIMLSGETSIGKYPVLAVETMARIAIETERNINYAKRFNALNVPPTRNITNAISHATCETAHTLGAAAIVTVTKSGSTARKVSKFRPASPVIATTVSHRVYRQLAITWGVTPVLTEMKDSTDEIFEQAIEKAQEKGNVRSGDLIVISGGMPAGISGTTNTLKVHIVGDVLLEGKGANALKATGTLCVVQHDSQELKYFSAGDILVIDKSSDDVLLAIKNAAAVITEEDDEDSKATIVARALEIPVLTGAINATNILKSGTVVTVDARRGQVFSGVRD